MTDKKLEATLTAEQMKRIATNMHAGRVMALRLNEALVMKKDDKDAENIHAAHYMMCLNHLAVRCSILMSQGMTEDQYVEIVAKDLRSEVAFLRSIMTKTGKKKS